MNTSLCVVDFSLPLDLDLGFVRLENGVGAAFGGSEEEKFEDGSEERRGKKNGREVSGVKEELLMLLFVRCCCCCCRFSNERWWYCALDTACSSYIGSGSGAVGSAKSSSKSRSMLRFPKIEKVPIFLKDGVLVCRSMLCIKEGGGGSYLPLLEEQTYL